MTPRSKNTKKIKKPLHKYKLVMVEWVDAQSDPAWGELVDIEKWANESYIVNEVGWLISETKKHIVMCSEIGSDGSMGNRTKIPNTWVISRKVLKLK